MLASAFTDRDPGGLIDRKPSLGVIIVSYNVRDLLRASIQATLCSLELVPDLAATVYVVDNASADSSADMVSAEFPQVRLIASQQNLGFAAANNLALRRMGFADATATVRDGIDWRASDEGAHPTFVLLLNPDAEPQGGAVGELVRFLVEHPQAGGATARLSYADGSFQHGAFAFPGLLQLFFDLFPPRPRFLLESRLNGRYSRRMYDSGQPFAVDFGLGAALMVRGRAVEEAGLLDEGYFMYAEEVDWCWRMRQLGWPFFCVPTALVVHHGGASAGQFRTQSFLNLWRSRQRLYSRFYGRRRRQVASVIVRLGMLAEARRLRAAAARGSLEADEAAERIAATHLVREMFS